MKICILATSYPRTKDDYWVPFMHSWARELAKREDVIVVTSGGHGTKDFEIMDKVRIYRFNYFYPKNLQALTYTGGIGESFKKSILAKLQAPFFIISFMLKPLKIAKKCDVINAHWTLSGLAALPLKWLYKKPIVLTEHGGGIRMLPKWLNQFIVKRMDAVTSAHYDMLKIIKDMKAKKVVDIKNFLNEEKFLKSHDKAAIKKRLKLKNEHIVTFIGRFEPLKDPLTFVNSIPYVLKSMKNVKFIIVGDGHLKGEIENQIKKLNLKDYVIMPEPTADVDKFLAVSDIFIACSATENCFSTTILEAMLSKVPCIITKAGMTERFFIHQKDAHLVEKKNPGLLGEAVISMLKNAKLRKRLSQNGLKFLDRYEFRNKFIKEKIMKVFKEVTKT